MSIRDKRITYHRAVTAHMAVRHKVMIFRPRRILSKLRRVNGLKHPQRAVGIAPHNILGVAYLPVMPRTRLRARRNDKCKNDRQQIYQIPHRFSFYPFFASRGFASRFPLMPSSGPQRLSQSYYNFPRLADYTRDFTSLSSTHFHTQKTKGRRAEARLRKFFVNFSKSGCNPK